MKVLLVLTARAVELEMCLRALRATAVIGSCCSLPSDQTYRATTGEPNDCFHSDWPTCTTGGRGEGALTDLSVSGTARHSTYTQEDNN